MWVVLKYFSQLRGEGRACIPPAGKWTTPLQGRPRPPTPVRTETPGILWHAGPGLDTVLGEKQLGTFKEFHLNIDQRASEHLRTSHCRDEEGKRSPREGKHNLQISHAAMTTVLTNDAIVRGDEGKIPLGGKWKPGEGKYKLILVTEVESVTAVSLREAKGIVYSTSAWRLSSEVIKTRFTIINSFLEHHAECAVTQFMGHTVSSVTHHEDKKEQNSPQQMAVVLSIADLFELPNSPLPKFL